MDAKLRLSELLQAYTPESEKEVTDRAQMLEFVQTLTNPLSRSERAAHFTGSAVVVHPDLQQVCVNFHGKLKRWMHVGGHGEEGDNGDIAETALREAHEETGLEVRHFKGVPYLFDLDIHSIPERGNEPEHLHLDLRFLLLATSEQIILDPNESSEVRWFSWDEACAKVGSDFSSERLFKKARRIVQGASP